MAKSIPGFPFLRNLPTPNLLGFNSTIKNGKGFGVEFEKYFCNLPELSLGIFIIVLMKACFYFYLNCWPKVITPFYLKFSLLLK